MATREVIVYICDNCPSEAEPESKKKTLPKGWVDMTVVSNDGELMCKHLCPSCLSVALKALIRRNARVAKK